MLRNLTSAMETPGASPSEPLRWAPERRLEFIDFRLFWEGRVNRADLIQEFGISVPQASLDLTRYQEVAPANMVYDKSAKTYVASADFRPSFFKPDADSYLNSLRSISDQVVAPEQTWIGRLPEFAALPLPRRITKPEHLRAILGAIRGAMAMKIRYQSMSKPAATWRWISPHALGFDGFRWHARSFCHVDQIFKDFLLPRILEVGELGPSEGNAADDRLWNENIVLRIAPHPMLTTSQRKAIELDYGMTRGSVALEVRAVLTYYARKRLGLDASANHRPPTDQQIILENADEVEARLQELQESA